LRAPPSASAVDDKPKCRAGVNLLRAHFRNPIGHKQDYHRRINFRIDDAAAPATWMILRFGQLSSRSIIFGEHFAQKYDAQEHRKTRARAS